MTISLTDPVLGLPGPQQVLHFEYDSRSRRIHKQGWGNSTGNGSPTNDLKFVYDGWNLVQELNSGDGSIRSYLWGLDLSGSSQGAGGVGGLLECVYDGSPPTNSVVAFDGNGNLIGLINGGDGSVLARFDYRPFGELLRATGPLAKVNPVLFSTKYQDDESDFLYFGYRLYDPSTGRWLSRDPIEEQGGPNEYSMVGNCPTSAYDLLGLVIQTVCPIDDYLTTAGVEFMRLGNGPYTYAFAGTDAGFGAASERLILIRMLLTAHIFKPSNTSGSEADNLKKHVEARLTIVRNALKAAFSFAPGHQTIDWSGFREDPQAFFEKLSNAHTKMGCQLATRIIFETGNKFGPDRFRNYDFVWIPGDWGYITNLAHVNGTGNFPPGYEGENVIHTARSSRGEMFWGLYQSGIHPADSETGWFEEIRKWRGNHEEQGVPAWQRRITYPSAGLSE